MGRKIKLIHEKQPEKPLLAGESGKFEFLICMNEELPTGGKYQFFFPSNWTVPQTSHGLSQGIIKIASDHPWLQIAVQSDVFKHTVTLINNGETIHQGEIIKLKYGAMRDGRPGVTVPGHARIYTGDEIEASFGFEIQPGEPAGAYCAVTPAMIPPGEKVYFTTNIVDNCGNVTPRGDLSIYKAAWWKLPEEALCYDYSHSGFQAHSFLRNGLLNETWQNMRKFCLDNCKQTYKFSEEFNEAGTFIAGVEVEKLGWFFSNPFVVSNKDEYLVFGDPHVHTERSDGIYPASYAYRYAMEVSGLGFISTTDHEGGWPRRDHWHLNPSNEITLASEDSWNENTLDCKEHYLENRFITLLGTEWTSGIGHPNGSGHRNIYFPGLEGRPFDPNHPEENSIEKLLNCVRETECLVVPHHPGVHMLWDVHDSHKERLVEIYSTWGCSEYPANDLWELTQWPDGFIQKAWEKGMLLGVIAGSDSHITTPGYPGCFNRLTHITYRPGITGAYISSVSRKDLYDALFNRRTYGTTGQKILLRFEVNGNATGSVVKSVSGRREISIEAIGEVPIIEVEILRNNRVVHKWEGMSLQAKLQWSDMEPIEDTRRGWPGKNIFYYIRVLESDGGRAWSSPIWIVKGDN